MSTSFGLLFSGQAHHGPNGQAERRERTRASGPVHSKLVHAVAERGEEWNGSRFGLPSQISDAVDIVRSLRFADKRRDEESGHHDRQPDERQSHNGPFRL